MQLIYIQERLFTPARVLHSWGSAVPSSQKEKDLILFLCMKGDASTLLSFVGF